METKSQNVSCLSVCLFVCCLLVVILSRNEWSQWLAILDMFSLKLYQSKV